VSARIRCVVVAVAVFAVTPAHAESDLQLWLEPGIAKRFDKRWELSFDQHLRFDQNLSRVQAVMPELALAYRLHKLLRVGIGYRLQYERNKDGVMVLRHRGQVEVRPRYEIGGVQLTHRLRFQEEVRGSFASDDLRHTIRNRLAIALEVTKPLVPAISAETFHRLGDGDTIHLQKIRLTAGASYELDDSEIELFYRIEVAQYDPTDPTPHIIGVGYRYTL
jgi:hypothetical protein